jgi:predicted alpha-1,2-mannosidase
MKNLKAIILAKTGLAVFCGIVLLFFVGSCRRPVELLEPAAYVNPFIGTDWNGHVYPGATLPFGKVQLSPQTRIHGWNGASGYHYSDSLILGFAHTALSGTGVSDYGDILIMPGIGEPRFFNEEYRSAFKKENEHANAGFYSVYLHDLGVLAELTTTTRVGYHRYTFPEGSEAFLLIDLQHRDRVTDSWIEIISDTEIRGHRRSTSWANDQILYFHMEFSKPFINKGIALNDSIHTGLLKANGLNIKAYVGFDVTAGEPVEVKVSLSAVDAEGAYKNMQYELPGWDFDQVRQQAFDTWNEVLGRIRVKGGTREQKEVFYTALYRSYLQPNTFMDVDRRYRGMDRKVHVAEGFDNYTIFSLWDTYRTWHPLMTILEPELSNNFIRVMLNMYKQRGLLPVWELAANETYTMIGYHSVSVIADAFVKGLRDFDYELALEAMKNSAMQDHFGLRYYRKYGYIPGDRFHESVSKTIEYAYNDWCIAQMAKAMGRDDVYREYILRAQFYKNIFDPTTGFMRPKLNGNWLSPFDPYTVDWHFTEANSWQYSFYVPHDMTGLYTLHGGKEQLSAKIDQLFTTSSVVTGRDMKDITGMIGQYAHGNEPSHHVAYLYNFLNQPWKTQQRVRQIMDELYSNQPDGLPGNEDCGQMSAWLIMSAMGFYPVAPGVPEYVIGTPWFEEMEITLENGKVFKITANRVSSRRYYIQSATLNGVDHPYSFITHQDIMNGGHLHFEMGRRPNKNWGSADEHIPVTDIKDERITPVPFFISGEARIRDSILVEMGSIIQGQEIFYTLDGTIPSRNSSKYTGPITLDTTVTVTAIAYQEGVGYSFPASASFVKINIDRSVEVLTEWHPNYHAGGAEALIDGLRGGINWRLGGWHGYQGTDFEAVVDLGSVQQIQSIGAGFVQDIRAWIWMPVEVSYYISSDGENFNRVARILNTVANDDFTPVLRELSAPVNRRARFVKVKATNFGVIPQWHLGAGNDAYIFVDEIVIK